MGVPDSRIDDGDHDAGLAECHIPGGIRADFADTPLAYAIEVRIVWKELCMNREIRGDSLTADDWAGRPDDERGSDGENGEECGHPSK
jgi:hypothetical protein